MSVCEDSPVCWGRCSPNAPRVWGRDNTCGGMAGRFQCNQINTDTREWDEESASASRARTETSPHSPPESNSTEISHKYFCLFCISLAEGRVFTLYSQRFWGGLTPRSLIRSSSARTVRRWAWFSMLYGGFNSSSSPSIKSSLWWGDIP